MANPIFLQQLRQFNDPLIDNDLLLVKVKRRVNMPADEDMGVRYSKFVEQLQLNRFVQKAGDTMLGDLVFVNNRGVFGTTTSGAFRSILKLDNSDTVLLGSTSNTTKILSKDLIKVNINGTEYVSYHSGNSNLATVDWRAKNLVADQTLWVNGESTFGNVTIRKLSAIYGYDAGNLKVRMIGIDADDDVAVGVATKRFGILVKSPDEIWAVQEEGNPAKQWRVLTTGNFTNHLNSTYVLKTQTVNGKALAGNITLNAADVGAVSKTGDILNGVYTLNTTGDTDSNPHLFGYNVFKSGSIAYGVNFLNSKGQFSTGTDLWSTNIYVPDQSNKWITFSAKSTTRELDATDYVVKARINMEDGELYLNGGVSRAYHQQFKPTPAELGAVSVTDDTYWKNRFFLDEINNPEATKPGFYFFIPETANNPEYSFGHMSTISAGGSAGEGTWATQMIFEHTSNHVLFRNIVNTLPVNNWARFYTTSDKPTPPEIGAYSTQEVDQKVRKVVVVNAPAGVVDGKYYPILIKNTGDYTYLRVTTKGSSGADPMNCNTFEGMVQAGGWSDRPSIIDGVYTQYNTGELAIAGIAIPSQNPEFYAVYVEARAFPVRVTVDGAVDVSTSATNISWAGATFNAGIGINDAVGTNVQWGATFRDGNGHYINSNKINPSGGGSGGTFGQVATFAFPPEEPWIVLDGRAFDTVKYPKLAQKYPSGHVPNWLNRYPKFYNGSEGAGSTYGGSYPSHSHSFSANTSTFDYGTKGTSGFDYGTKSGTTSTGGNHNHTFNGVNAGSSGSGAEYNGWVGKFSTDYAGNHNHTVSIGIGAHSHSVGIGAHSHSVSGTTGGAGSGSTVETDRVVLIPAIYAA